MTDGRLASFLEYYLHEKPEIQALPDIFSVVVANPADTAARGGIVVDQLETPDQCVYLKVLRPLIALTKKNLDLVALM